MSSFTECGLQSVRVGARCINCDITSANAKPTRASAPPSERQRPRFFFGATAGRLRRHTEGVKVTAFIFVKHEVCKRSTCLKWVLPTKAIPSNRHTPPDLWNTMRDEIRCWVTVSFHYYKNTSWLKWTHFKRSWFQRSWYKLFLMMTIQRSWSHVVSHKDTSFLDSD